MPTDALALDYLRDVSARMTTTYLDDCVAHATRIAALLIVGDCAPWIASIRDVTNEGSYEMHHPLIPSRFPAMTWNVHYVCCNGTQAYDPIIGEPCSVDELAMNVFGRAITVGEAVSVADVARLATAEVLKTHIASLRRLRKG
ncbi:MAG TPA: hypothetical protein VGQ76_04430 [Thermoanaerobaculia bacterium]|jgi:hypothetical protein|nr:hypothetical protein [Thermoanaerobaculia bacterium]